MSYYIKIGDSFTEIKDVIKYTQNHLMLKNTQTNRGMVRYIKDYLYVLTWSKDKAEIRGNYVMTTLTENDVIDVMLGASE